MTLAKSVRNSELPFAQDALKHILSARYNIKRVYPNMLPCTAYSIQCHRDFCVVVKRAQWFGVCTYETIYAVWTESSSLGDLQRIVSKPLLRPIGPEIRAWACKRVVKVHLHEGGKVGIHFRPIEGASSRKPITPITFNIDQALTKPHDTLGDGLQDHQPSMGALFSSMRRPRSINRHRNREINGESRYVSP